MMEPTIAEDGHTYEKAAIAEWLNAKGVSPMTGEKISKHNLILNRLVRARIRDFLEKCKGDGAS
jgi:hypothetical protein